MRSAPTTRSLATAAPTKSDSVRSLLSRVALAALALAASAGLADRAVAQSTYSWNTTSGTWNATAANWVGAGSVWVNGTASQAVFANTATSSTIALGGSLTAGTVTIGNGGNNANYTFTAGSLAALSFTLQGEGLNEPALAGYPASTLTDVALSVAGDLGVGRGQVVIGGTSVVTANRIGGAGMTGVTSADWGQVTIQDSAFVTATNGIVGATTAWGLNLNGGTLFTSGINYGPQSFEANLVNLNFNSGLVLASQNNSDFITTTGGLDVAPVIQAGGARINTNGFDIGIGLPLAGSGRLTKFGAGTLTLSGASTYSGGTTLNTGTVVAGAQASFGGAGPLGISAPTNVVTINAGGVLTGTTNNWLDNTALAAGGTNAHSVVVNAGGVLRGGVGVVTGLGNTTLAGGTIAVTEGLSGFGWNGSFALGGNVTVSGSVASAITTAAGGSGAANIQMSDGTNGVGGTRTFTVNDVTGNAASDLVVSARLANGTAVKAGPGTLELAAGATGTGTPVNWRIDAGTLRTTAANVLGGASVSSTSTASTFDLGGTTQTLPGLGASGSGNGYRGTITNGTLDLNGTNAYVQEGTFTMNLTGAGSRLYIGGDPSATVLLGGTNLFTNPTVIGQVAPGVAGPTGTVRLLSPQALGSSGVTAAVLNGSTLDLNGQADVSVAAVDVFGESRLVNSSATPVTYAGLVRLGNTSTGSPAQFGGTGDLTLNGGVVHTSGANRGFTKVGTGTLTLTAAGSVAAIRIDAGTLRTTAANALGGAIVSSTSASSALDLGGTTQVVGGLAASGSGNGYRGTITNGTIELSGTDAFLQEGTFTMNLTGSGRVLRIGGDPSATVFLGGTNSLTGVTSTIIGGTVGGANTDVGTVKLLSPQALGLTGQTALVRDLSTLDLNGQSGITVSTIALLGVSGVGGRLVNSSGTAATFAGEVRFLSDNVVSQVGGEGDMTLTGTVFNGQPNGGFSKVGTGTLTLAAAITSFPRCQIDAGTLVVNTTVFSTVNVAAAGRLQGSGTIGGGVNVLGTFAPGNFTVGPLTIGGTMTLSGSAVTTVNASALAVAETGTGGRVDLGVGRISIAAGGITPEALVIDILAGRDGNPAAVWTGSTGITSSVAAQAIATGASPRAVGWIDDGSGGLSVAFSAPGDTNIDGLVDILDVANFLGSGKYDSGQPAVWSEGDFGYDGMVDILDVADFLGTGLFDAGSYLPAAAPAAPPAVTAVPEPTATAAAVALAVAAWILGRRR